jgi:chemotaxis protein methyltransferase CheR
MLQDESKIIAVLRRHLEDWTGFRLSPQKDVLIKRRLRRRLEATGYTDLEAYLRHIQVDLEERKLCINAVTTNVTAFDREPHHFQILAETLKRWQEREPTQRSFSAWSSACSTGEEPYQIAMCMLENCRADLLQAPFVLATDLNSEVLQTARKGCYSLSSLEPFSQEFRRKFFHKGVGAQTGLARVKPELASSVAFKPLNLIEPWKLISGFSVIFCRNVLIYFSEEQQNYVVDRLVNQLTPGGLLFLGHSESLRGKHPLLKWVGQTVYARIDG